MFLQRHTLAYIRRSIQYDSRFREKLPVVRPASKVIKQTLRKRRDAETNTKNKNYTPQGFEPFPFHLTENNKLETIQRLLTPLHDIPYEEQLSAKESKCRNTLRVFGQDLYKSGTPVRLNVTRLPCHVNPIVKTQNIYSCRNKNQFGIWRGLDGKTNTVGFWAFPISKHGDTVSVEPDGCLTISDETIKLTAILQEFIRHQAKLSVCFDIGEAGGWSRYVVRSNREGHLMLIGVVSPRMLRVKQLIDEKENFKEFVTKKCEMTGLQLKSLYLQACPHTSCTHEQVPYELLYGSKTITETVNQFKITISPETHIHRITEGAENLYNTVRASIIDCFELSPDSGEKPLIIDTNCGTGALSFHLADLAHKVIGVDRSSLAVEDSRHNASLNGIGNSEFIKADLQVIFEKILEKHSRDRESIVVCNPSREGLRSNVIECMRTNRKVSKIVYVTSTIDGRAVSKNLLALCSKRAGNSPPPFAPISATPVDNSPLTEPFDTVLVLERLPS